MNAGQFVPNTGNTTPLRLPVTAPPPPRNRQKIYFLGLVVLSVVAGLVWYLIRHEDPIDAPVASPPVAPEFTFALTEGPVVSTDCAAHSYGETKTWFTQHPCSRLARALYTVTTGSNKALVSVSLVSMPTGDEAQQLKGITDSEDTGNVADLIREGAVKIPGAPKIADGQYDSRRTNNELIVVEAAFFGGYEDQVLLKRITAQALGMNGALR